jgi:hypothetical protein
MLKIAAQNVQKFKHLRSVIIMKKFILSLITLSSTSLIANIHDNLESYTISEEEINIDSEVHNPDKSVTFKNISVQRGDQTFEIDGSRTSYDSVCKMLGYENSLTGSNLNSLEVNGPSYWTLVSLNDNGQYADTIRSDKKITKVTCYNASELSPVTEFDKNDNSDGSSTIEKITYLRGDQTFEIDATITSFDSVCKMVGFEKSLSGSNLNTLAVNGPGYWTLVNLNNNGQYIKTLRSDKKITKVTCFNGTEPNLIIQIDGNRYRRQQSKID